MPERSFCAADVPRLIVIISAVSTIIVIISAVSTIIVIIVAVIIVAPLSGVPANRETAIVQALVTSGVMYVVARNCSTGALLSCTCDSHLHDNHTGKQAPSHVKILRPTIGEL